MREYSKEVLEIGGKEYTLFLNRKGIVAWEKYVKKEKKEIEKMDNDLAIVLDKDEEITNETNPFEGLDEPVDKATEDIRNMFKKLFWIALYTEHKLSIEESSKLYDIASSKEEYGEEQLILFLNQMLEDANSDKVSKEEPTKKIAALRPTK